MESKNIALSLMMEKRASESVLGAFLRAAECEKMIEQTKNKIYLTQLFGMITYTIIITTSIITTQHNNIFNYYL